MLRTRRSLPWKSLEELLNVPFELQNDLSRTFFGPASQDSERSQRWPRFNVWSTEHELIVTAEIPGLDPEQIDVDVNHDLLTVSSTVKPEELSEDEAYQRHERLSGRFERSLRLPYEVDPERSDAQYVDGVLEIRLAKPERDKPRKVAVNAG